MKKTLSLFLAFILLFSNAGFTLATHYCGGEALMSRIMVGSEPMGCGMAGMDESDSAGQETHSKTTPCCENHYQLIEVEDDYHPSKLLQLNIQADYVAAFVSVYFVFPPHFPKKEPQYLTYSPPPLLRDIPVLHQVFLI